MPPKGVDDWSLDWLKIQKGLREYLDQANAGSWPLAAATAERLAYCAMMLEQHARSRKPAGD